MGTTAEIYHSPLTSRNIPTFAPSWSIFSSFPPWLPSLPSASTNAGRRSISAGSPNRCSFFSRSWAEPPAPYSEWSPIGIKPPKPPFSLNSGWLSSCRAWSSTHCFITFKTRQPLPGPVFIDFIITQMGRWRRFLLIPQRLINRSYHLLNLNWRITDAFRPSQPKTAAVIIKFYPLRARRCTLVLAWYLKQLY